METLAVLVATTSVERVFSAINIIKSDIQTVIGNDWVSD
jgi:hypothetical protein